MLLRPGRGRSDGSLEAVPGPAPTLGSAPGLGPALLWPKLPPQWPRPRPRPCRCPPAAPLPPKVSHLLHVQPQLQAHGQQQRARAWGTVHHLAHSLLGQAQGSGRALRGSSRHAGSSGPPLSPPPASPPCNWLWAPHCPLLMKRCHRRGGCPDQLSASKRIPPAHLLTRNRRVGFVHRMNFLKEGSENRMNRDVYGFHFLSFLVSHPVISAYTNLSLEGRILLFQMTDSQPASRKGLS